jgi:eukaryotic-like serine/threonine-protein kinase
MGEVYKARDTRLDRSVAIKVSRAEFSERFEREARVIATLNHPHICQLYDVGPDYLVMEYIEGTPLRGPLPLDQTLKYAAQICDALDAAHKKNITHRDLKPANILVTKAGVKLLDFGLASFGPVIRADEATVVMAQTGEGEILGTLLYMSPEQVNGQDAGPQSDIFSFGLVLYEMLMGKRAFEGSTPASIIAGILERPAPSVSDVAPAPLDRVLKRCLEKDPENRWQSARDLKAELEWIANAPEFGSPAPAPANTMSRLRGLPAIALVFLAIALAVALGALWRAARPVDSPLQPLVHLDVDLGADVSLGSTAGPDVVISPDETRLAYVSQGRLFTRRLDQPKATELAGTQGAFAPFFSPDGQWVGFFADNKLKKIPVEGGTTINLCDTGQGTGGSWGEDGNIIAALTPFAILSRIPSAGGAPTPVTELKQQEITHRWPQILPGGKAVLFTANSSALGGFDEASIEVISLGDRRRKTLQRDATFGRYLPSGHLIYLHRGTIFAVPFDLGRLEIRGTPAAVLENVGYSSLWGFGQVDFSRRGTLVYGGVSAGGNKLLTVQWLDSTGRTQPLLTRQDHYLFPHLSPDGQRLAVSTTDLWVYEWNRDAMTRLTFDGLGSVIPMWSPDGRYILFGTQGGMFWTRSDGAGKPQQLTRSKNLQGPMSFTPDGRRLAFQESDPKTKLDIWTVPLEGAGASLRLGKPEVFLQTPAIEGMPAFSPDGRWLAYVSNESGAFQVYVRAFPDTGGKWQISSGGGLYPMFSNDGREMFFRTEDNRIMVAAYTAKGDSFVSDNPRVWSEKRIGNVGLFKNFDLAPDGKRIVALMPAEGPQAQQSQNHVVFLENFFDELRRRMPAGK